MPSFESPYVFVWVCEVKGWPRAFVSTTNALTVVALFVLASFAGDFKEIKVSPVLSAEIRIGGA